MKCIIIDDDILIVKYLSSFLNKNPEIELIGQFDSAKDAITSDLLLEADLILLDVEMPEMNGFEFLQQNKLQAQIILISGNSNYAIEGYGYEVSDFLAKPFDIDRLNNVISKAQNRFKESIKNSELEEESVFMKVNGVLQKVYYTEISYIEANSDYINIYTDQKRFTILSRLKDFEEKLKLFNFLKIHRSYIVCTDKIEKVEGNSVIINNKVIPVSRSYKSELLNKLHLV